MGLFDAMTDLLGHDVQLKTRAYGKTRHFWSVCDCGYESAPGKSKTFAINSGIGHLRRISQRIGRGVDEGVYDPHEISSPEIPRVSGGRA